MRLSQSIFSWGVEIIQNNNSTLINIKFVKNDKFIEILCKFSLNHIYIYEVY